MRMRQKKIFLWKKKIKMANSKKGHFSKPPILNIFCENFMDWSLLNLYGCEAVWHKLKNCLKTQKTYFLPVFELMPDSLTTVWVKPHQCPSHQSILLTQGPICEIFTKKFRELAILKNGHFEKSAILNFFLQKKKIFFASFSWKSVQICMVEWMGRNFEVFPGFQQIPCYA